jgi:peptide/nickel transport system permease protein
VTWPTAREGPLGQAPHDVAAADPVAIADGQQDIGRSPWQIFWRRFRKDKAAIAGIWVIGVLLLLAVLAPLLVKLNGHPPNELFPGCIDQEFGVPIGPHGKFWLGCDSTGRDLFTRILYGARVSLLVAFVATGISVAMGTLMGMIAAYYGGWADSVISRVMDILLAFPILLLALGLGASCGGQKGCFGGLVRPGLSVVIFVIALANWPYLARIVRGQVLSIREKEFVDAARTIGSSDGRIIAREILPNLAAPIIVYSTLIIPTNILFEAALSFLGVGINPPNASWGQMIADSVPSFQSHWWYFMFPGLFLLGTVLAFNLVGDGLRDALEPGRGA